MNFRYLEFLSAALVATCMANGAGAQDKTPDLTGTWICPHTIAIVVGSNPHKPGQSGITYSDVNSKIVIEEQKDRRFVGRVETSFRTERLVGVIAPDFENGAMVDEDGSYTYEVHDANTLEICYSHVLPDTRVVTCNNFTRTTK